MRDFAILYPETCRPARIIASVRIDRRSDHRSDKQPRPHLRNQVVPADIALRQRQIGHTRRRRRRCATAGVGSGWQTQLAPSGKIQRPARQRAIVDQRAALRRQTFGIENLGCKGARAVGVFDQAHAFWQDLLAQRIAQERRAARDGAAVDCLHKMTNNHKIIFSLG